MTEQPATVVSGPSVVREEVTEDELRELSVDLARDFPGSTAADFRRYPVLAASAFALAMDVGRCSAGSGERMLENRRADKPITAVIMP